MGGRIFYSNCLRGSQSVKALFCTLCVGLGDKCTCVCVCTHMHTWTSRKGVEVNDVLVLNSDSKIDISIPTEKTG